MRKFALIVASLLAASPALADGFGYGYGGYWPPPPAYVYGPDVNWRPFYPRVVVVGAQPRSWRTAPCVGTDLSCLLPPSPAPYSTLPPPPVADPPARLSRDQEREAIIKQGEAFCLKYKNDPICHPPKDQLR